MESWQGLQSKLFCPDVAAHGFVFISACLECLCVDFSAAFFPYWVSSLCYFFSAKKLVVIFNLQLHQRLPFGSWISFFRGVCGFDVYFIFLELF